MSAESLGILYESIGDGYAVHRRPEASWQIVIDESLGAARSVLNVGAGTGSYEPVDRTVIAVEPSTVMIRQRSATSAPVVRAVAERLPFADASFDAAMAVLTVHHWNDPDVGLAELQRVAPRQVVLTWDPVVVASKFWFARDYLPQVQERERDLATLEQVLTALGPNVETIVLPVPADCSDGFFGAFWRRPHMYLDPAVRAGMSAIALLSEAVVAPAIAQLATDLADGTWAERYADITNLPEVDLGYRLVVAN